MSHRLSIDHYAMLLACAARLRSEDPYLKVGAAALSHENRVIATAYNGPRAGFNPPPGFWEDREGRLPHMLHAEVNLCSLFTRGAARTVAVTTLPCSSCASVLVAHGVRRVVYGQPYHRDGGGEDTLKMAEVELVQVTADDLTAALVGLGIGVRVAVRQPELLRELPVLPGITYFIYDGVDQGHFIVRTGKDPDGPRSVTPQLLNHISCAVIATVTRYLS